MENQVRSLMAFIGAKDFNTSRSFYRDFGFQENPISSDLSFFKKGQCSFYLQDYYVKDWVDNSMLFLEVDNVEAYFEQLQKLDLTSRYESAKLIPIQKHNWGKVGFVHDPSGILWQIGEFHQ